MVKIRPKTTIQMKLSGVGETHSRSRISVRDVTSTIDEPVERHGTNQGLSPTETLMSSLIGCTNVISNKIAAQMGIEIARMEIALTADFDRRGVTLAEEVDQPFSNIVMDIEVTTNGNEDQIENLRIELEKFCPVAKVFRGAGITLTENWTVKPL